MKFKKPDGYLEERQAETLTACLAALDYCLTGKRPQGHQPEHDLYKWLEGGELFYLSDGGYSRLGYDRFSGTDKIFLTSGSTEKVRENWRQVQFLRERIEDLMKEIRQTIKNKPTALEEGLQRWRRREGKT